MSWLLRHNPRVDWPERQVRLTQRGRGIILQEHSCQASAEEKQEVMVSAVAARRLLQQGAQAYLAVVYTAEEQQQL